MKNGICALAGAIGSAVVTLFGGWDRGVETLLFFMAIDYISGLVVAGIFKRSPKTKTGALESRAGWKGLCRKCMTLLLILVAHRLDMALGISYLREAVVIGFIINESLSLLENAGLMGIPIPEPIRKALELLSKKTGTDLPEGSDGNEVNSDAGR